MKKFAALVALGAVLSAGAAFAQTTMQNTFGNTIVVTYANGSEARYFFNEDGTFTGVAPGGSSQMAGRWTVDGEQLCLIPPSGQQACTTVAADKNVGDTWEQTATDGSAITVTLQAGR